MRMKKKGARNRDRKRRNMCILLNGRESNSRDELALIKNEPNCERQMYIFE